jgi:phosphate transport system substrate-binding protein
VRTRSIATAGSVAVVALGLAACGSSNSSSSSSSSSKPSATISGAGSTFAAPIYQQVSGTLKSQGLTVNYQPVGSGAGISQLQNGTVQWAGSDPALAPADRTGMKGPVTQLPIAFGAITASYNLSGQKSGIKLDGQTLADIYLGKVKTWNDAEITALNPGLKLPSTTITVVHRSDSSGTTKGFTQFLANYSSAWKSGPGVDKDIKWPTGTGAKGNDGVAAAVKQTDGAIGYVEQAYALQNNFTFADVKNKSGAFIAPTLASTSAAAEGLTIPADLGISTIDSANPAAYPIVSQTFLDFPTDGCKSNGFSSGTQSGLVQFAKYLTGSAGQGVIKQLSFAPLTSELVSKDAAAIAKVTCNGSPVSGS